MTRKRLRAAARRVVALAGVVAGALDLPLVANAALLYVAVAALVVGVAAAAGAAVRVFIATSGLGG